MFTLVIILNCQEMKATKCLSADEWTNKILICIYNGMLFNLKSKGNLTPGTTWVSFGDTSSRRNKPGTKRQAL
jgi:hypothetical protein